MRRSDLDAVTERIARACDRAGRDPAGVTLVAVSKTYPADAIRAAYDLGLRHFGESRWQEAEDKIATLPSDIVWHFIGRLQTNKAKRIAGAFDVVHSVERLRQAEALAAARRPIEALLQVELAGEAQKAGVEPETLVETWSAVVQCPHVVMRGLMTVGPLATDPEGMRTLFRSLRTRAAGIGAEWLSMGMSADFDVAIEEGATHVRVGSALFGPRG